MMMAMMVSAISGAIFVMTLIKPLPVCRMAKKIEANTTPTGEMPPSRATATPSKPCEGWTPMRMAVQ